MERKQIEEAVNKIFWEQFELGADELKPEKELFTDLEMDSLDIVDLMVAMQSKFDVSLRQNEDIRNVRTLGDVYDFVEKLAEENPELAAKMAEDAE